ncbi:MAG: Hsp20 family protein [Alphaproteobacteria bacterium]|nr:Hsp20 family protein [Alphaproteobacteria bacterium]
MTSGRLTLFDSPLFLGFDQLEETFQRMRKSAGDGYPPYNIEQTGTHTLRITLAVAGFTMDELDVEIEQTQLVIRGRQNDDDQRVYLHRGIAARQFQRAFVLADGMEVKGAALDNGLLHIDLEQLTPERVVKKIEIKNAEGDGGHSQAIDVEATEVKPKPKK